MAEGDVFAIKLHMVFAGQQCRPGFYLIEGAGVGGTTPTEAAAFDVRATLAGANLPGFSSALSLVGVEAQDVQPRTSRSALSSYVAPLVGNIADDNPAAPQDSMLIRWTTAKKRGKGIFAADSRTYVPGIYGTGQIGGFLIADLQDALSAFASLLFDAYVTSATNYQMHAVAFNAGNPRTVKAIAPITAFSIDNVVDIQRRRRPGRGI